MKSFLIKDTTREERERIVGESVGQIEAASTAVRRALSKCIRRISTGKRNCARSTANMSRTISPAARGRREANAGCSDHHKKHAPLTGKRRIEAAASRQGSVCVFEKAFCAAPWARRAFCGQRGSY